jgi:hypothetical protein
LLLAVVAVVASITTTFVVVAVELVALDVQLMQAVAVLRQKAHCH